MSAANAEPAKPAVTAIERRSFFIVFSASVLGGTGSTIGPRREIPGGDSRDRRIAIIQDTIREGAGESCSREDTTSDNLRPIVMSWRFRRAPIEYKSSRYIRYLKDRRPAVQFANSVPPRHRV